MTNIYRLADLGVNHYGDPLAEAGRCRKHSALFDFSFMSRARITGPNALHCINSIQSRDLSGMQSGDIRYCLSTDPAGLVEADLTVWKYSEDCYELFSGRAKDIEQLAAQRTDSEDFLNLSDSTSVFSLQGPKAIDLICALCDSEALRSLSYFQHVKVTICGIPCQVGRLGYSGEKGFEIVVDNQSMADILWKILADISPPAGVAAIDILRIEAGFILFLNECRLGCNALELGLSRFSGKDRLRHRYQLVCFRADELTIDLPWSPPQSLSEPVDREIVVTSASFSVVCEGVLGLGFVRYPCKFEETYVDPSNLFQNIKIVGMPFYDPDKKIPR